MKWPSEHNLLRKLIIQFNEDLLYVDELIY